MRTLCLQSLAAMLEQLQDGSLTKLEHFALGVRRYSSAPHCRMPAGDFDWDPAGDFDWDPPGDFACWPLQHPLWNPPSDPPSDPTLNLPCT